MTRRGLTTTMLGLVALGAALLRLHPMVLPSPEWPPWQLLLVGAAGLGAATGFIAKALRVGAAGALALAAAVTIVVLGRSAAPGDLVGGVVPTGAAWESIGATLSTGLEYLRYATVPVYPDPGFILLLVPALIGVGAGWAYLVATGRPAVAAALPAGFYLAVAMADQATTGRGWVLAAAVWTGALLVASGLDETRTLPRLLGPLPRTAAIVLGAVVVTASVVVTDAGSAAVAPLGRDAWVDGSGLGGLRRGVSVNLFASVVQSDLVNDSEEVAFRAVVSGGTTPGNRLYWRLITLDRYDGRTWRPTFDGADRGFEPDDIRFAGRTETMTQVVQVDGLRQQLLPTLYAPTAVSGDSPLVRTGVRPRIDGSLDLGGLRTSRGLTYEIVSDVPVADVTEIALAGGSGLPPLLAEAQRLGLIAPTDGVTVTDRTLPDRERFLALPSDVDARIGGLARDLTRGTTDPLERMVLLESFFRVPGLFTYDIDIRPGHGAEDLAAWLFDEDSPNHRTGYCEQFATALAVMGRSVGIPTRVVLGFSPGEVGADGVIIVRGRNAHAWVESWVDGAGWVRFDPTPRSAADNPPTAAELAFSLADVIPPDQANPLTELGGSPFFVDPSRFEDFLEDQEPTFDLGEVGEGVPIPAEAPAETWAPWLLLALVVVGALPAMKLVRRRRRLALAADGDISAAWAEIVDRLGDLDRPVEAWMTPAEVAASVGPELVPLATAHAVNRWGATPPGMDLTEQAMASFAATEASLRSTAGRWRSLVAWWRPGSLVDAAARINRSRGRR